jgi:hypothetical protein
MDLPNGCMDWDNILGRCEASVGDAMTKNWGFKPTKSLGIKSQPILSSKLGNQLKFANRRPNPEFEGSRSSAKMHRISIHEPHKEIWTQMPHNRRIEPHMKIAQNSLKKHENHSNQEKEIDATMNVSIQPEVRFSIKSWRKSRLKNKEMRKQSGWMCFPRTLGLYIWSLSELGKWPSYP